MNNEMIAIQFYKGKGLKRLNELRHILLEQPQQIIIFDIACGNQKEFIWFAPDEMRVNKVSVFCDNNSLLVNGNLVNLLIRSTILVG